MPIPVDFLGKRYKSQSEFSIFVKRFIYDIGPCNDLKNYNLSKFEILIEILKRHPDFAIKTKNMNSIKITNDQLNKAALKIIIINDDNTEIDISWKCAITGKGKSLKSELLSAMRSSVEQQINTYRQSNKGPCQLCGTF